jgi:hypothetical protein
MTSEAHVLRDVEFAIGALPGVLLRRAAVMITDPETGRRRFLPGLGPGTPDLVACIDGRWVGLEVKGKGGRPEQSQLEMQGQIRQAGGIYEFVWSADEAIELVERARVHNR